MHRGQIDLASMYEKKSVEKMSPFRRNGLKWTEWTRPCSISLTLSLSPPLNSGMT